MSMRQISNIFPMPWIYATLGQHKLSAMSNPIYYKVALKDHNSAQCKTIETRPTAYLLQNNCQTASKARTELKVCLFWNYSNVSKILQTQSFFFKFLIANFSRHEIFQK